MKRNYGIIFLILLIFFVISFLTNIIGPLVPDIIRSFDLSRSMAGFLPFAFFIAYGVSSIPAGMAIEKYREKKVMLFAFAMAMSGSLLFSVFPSYTIVLFSLFMIGMGMAVLQVAINPLLRVAGGEEHFAFNSVLAQLAFGGASFLSPQVFSYLVSGIESGQSDSLIISTLRDLVPAGLSWVSLYWIFTVVSVIMLLIIALVRFPKVELKEDEKAGGWDTYKELFASKTVWLFFLAIFCYVGVEQGIANWISEYLYSYHEVDPRLGGADTVSSFWGLLTLGCLLGLVLLKFLDSRTVLKLFSLLALVSLLLALFGSRSMALVAFPACGFFASVMWSVIFSLALNSVKKHHGSFSGILCTGIVGGAVMPLIVGALADIIGLRGGMFFLILPLAYIFSVGFWARPLVSNATISLKTRKEIV
ncbi:MFS transporter [Robertkochia marina]|uniref:MFS transporter n=1 Tax=Robertkochia marina TaxID=1227945 RepID=A0A4S3M279_9FLAO|nr:MFS transporter [Robertkochia marina]THD69133.1 MFS transporter [Robertkochia marina]TRZ47607.1 MFS transporter [Robertkochia marina]